MVQYVHLSLNNKLVYHHSSTYYTRPNICEFTHLLVVPLGSQNAKKHLIKTQNHTKQIAAFLEN